MNNRVVRERDFLNNLHTRKPRIAKQIEEVFVVIRIKDFPCRKRALHHLADVIKINVFDCFTNSLEEREAASNISFRFIFAEPNVNFACGSIDIPHHFNLNALLLVV